MSNINKSKSLVIEASALVKVGATKAEKFCEAFREAHERLVR